MVKASYLSRERAALARAACIVFFLCVAMALASPAQILTTLHSFAGYPTEGAQPYAGLVQGSDGNFYGTTNLGGTNDNCNPYGCGTIFKVTPQGTLTTLYSFCLQFSCPDGADPQAALVLGTDGNFYGTTVASSYGGTVFKVSANGTLTMLYDFCTQHGCPDGAEPYASLVQGADGNFYGTTALGGANGGGTVFRITPAGALTTLYNFCSQPQCTDGTAPHVGLVQATDGNFYGTTHSGGGTNCSGGGCGTIFKISPQGTLTTLYAFCLQSGCLDGGIPDASLVQATDGNFYGVTFLGGTSPNCSPTGCGTIFKITAAGVLTTLYDFCPESGCADGTNPYAGLLQATDGNLYGTTYSGGSNGGVGTIFKITLGGTLTTLYTFHGNDGANPQAEMVQATDGNFYATTYGGGNDSDNCPGGCGTVFRLAVAPTQFVPVTPCRLVDTRQSQPIQGGTSESFAVPQLGGCNIPTSAQAYSLNVTAVPDGQLGYLTIWPTGEPQPEVSTLNSPDGRIKANAAIVPAGANGAVSVYVTDTSDVILDIDGYFAPAGSQTLQFYPLTPCRLVDTRGPGGPLGGPRLPAQQERDFPLLTNTTCIPAGLNPAAYSLNFTVVPNPSGQQLGYLTVWPTGDTQPVVSTLNNPTATVVANAAIVSAGVNGQVAVYAYNTTDLLIDIDGYFGAPGQTGLSLYPVAPCRVLDTRNVGNGQPFTGEKTVNVVGSTCAPPSSAQAYVFNATVVPPGSMPYLTLWADGPPQPTVSTLNAYDGFITSNMAIVPTTNGSIDAWAQGLTQLILDISGYFAP